MAMVFAGCSKDADESYLLDGTTWVCTEVDGMTTEDRITTIKFQKTTLTIKSDPHYNIDETLGSISPDGTYTYEPPLITIKLDEETTISGTIKDNAMSIKWTRRMDFIKK